MYQKETMEADFISHLQNMNSLKNWCTWLRKTVAFHPLLNYYPCYGQPLNKLFEDDGKYSPKSKGRNQVLHFVVHINLLVHKFTFQSWIYVDEKPGIFFLAAAFPHINMYVCFFYLYLISMSSFCLPKIGNVKKMGFSEVWAGQ